VCPLSLVAIDDFVDSLTGSRSSDSFLQEASSMTIFLCTVSQRFPENYHIGVQSQKWGVEEKYRQKLANVRPGDHLVFLVASRFTTLHTIESSPFTETTELWPEKDGSLFPHRVHISVPLATSSKTAKELSDDISFMKDKFWGGTIQGPNGVFNDKLTDDDIRLIFGDNWKSRTPTNTQKSSVKRTSSDSLLTFYEKDAEDCVESMLPEMGLTKYVDPETGKDGRQFVCSAGRIDLLCRDRTTDDLVIIELKRGDAADKTLLQLLRYMSWARQNIADGSNVRGIILTERADDSLTGIVEEVPNVTIRYYKFNIELVQCND
jgi:hypothetical protein